MSKITINGDLNRFIHMVQVHNGRQTLFFERRDEITTDELKYALSSLECIEPGQYINPAPIIERFLSLVEPTIENYKEIISVVLDTTLREALISQRTLPFSLDMLINASISTRSPKILEIFLEDKSLNINQLPEIIRKFVAASSSEKPAVSIGKALDVMTHMNQKFPGFLTLENALIQLETFDALRTMDISFTTDNQYYLGLVESMRAKGELEPFLTGINSNPEMLRHLQYQSYIAQEAIKYNFSLLPDKGSAIGYTEALFSLIARLDERVHIQTKFFATQIILKEGHDHNNYPLLIHLMQHHGSFRDVDQSTIRKCADSLLGARASDFYNSLLQKSATLDDYTKIFQAAYNGNIAPNIGSILYFYEYISKKFGAYLMTKGGYEAFFPGISKLLMKHSDEFKTDSMNYIKANFENASNLTNVKFLISLFCSGDVVEGLLNPIKIYDLLSRTGVDVQRLLEKLGTNILYYTPSDEQNLFEILIDRYPDALPLNFTSLNLLEKDNAVLVRTLNYAAARNHYEAAKQILYLLQGSEVENHILESRLYGDNISLFFARHATEAKWLDALDVLYKEFSHKGAFGPEESLYLRSFCLAPQINADEFSCILKLAAERLGILKFFVDNAILNINAESTEQTHYTALAHYVDIGDIDKVVQFNTAFEDKVDFNASGKKDYNPMMLAVAHGNLNMAKLLYRFLPDKNQCKQYRDISGYNLLHIAAEFGHINMINWIMNELPALKDVRTTCLFNVTDITLQNANVYTAMHLMSKYATSYTSTSSIMTDCDVLFKALMSRSPEEQAARIPKINQTIEFVVLTTHALITGTFADLVRKFSSLKESDFLIKLSEHAKPYMDALRDSIGSTEEELYFNLTERFMDKSLEEHISSPQYLNQLACHGITLLLDNSAAMAVSCPVVGVSESKDGDGVGFGACGDVDNNAFAEAEVGMVVPVVGAALPQYADVD